MKNWFTVKTKEGNEVVFMTDKLVCFSFNGKETIITTVEGEYAYHGDQRRNIGLAIGKLYSRRSEG